MGENTKTLTPEVRVGEDGNVTLGVVVGRKWLPFVTKNAGYLETLPDTESGPARRSRGKAAAAAGPVDASGDQGDDDSAGAS